MGKDGKDMVRKGKRVLGNEGSAFIVVLICMLLIGVIATAVLGLAQGNLKNIGTGIKSSDNFYEAEEALDELKDSLKQMANEAVKNAYEEYLQSYAINSLGKNEEELKKEFNKLFSTNIEESLKQYFVKTESETPSKNYLDLLYNYKGLVTTETDKKPIYEIDSDNVVHVKNIELTYRGDDGHVSTISTDLSFKVSVPSITLGSNVGLSTNVADFAVIADQTIRNDNSSPLIMGSIYGGGKNPTTSPTGNGGSGKNPTEKDAEGKDIYDQPGLLISGDGANVKLYSNMIISRSTLKVCNKANVEIRHTNDKRQVGIIGDDYSKIWVNNILMDVKEVGQDKSTNASTLKIKGNCYVGDDLTINTDGSRFELLPRSDGTVGLSSYYGYSTNRRLDDGNTSPADTSSSIVVNGKGVLLDLSKANMLWLAGKSYVSVPENWGDVNGASKTFQQGESISYRSLQAAYMLPGECIMGIGHNPMNLDEYISLLDYTDEERAALKTKAQNGTITAAEIAAIALKKPDVEISQSFLNEGMDLTKYLDLENPCSVEFVKYDNRKLAYVYMNFRTPNKAAEYFKDYFYKYNKLVRDRMSLFGNTGKLLINTSDEAYDSTQGIYTLGTSHVQTTGNIVYYDGTKMRLYYMNTDYTAVQNQQRQFANQFKNLYTSLDSSVTLPDRQPLTANITDIDWLENTGDAVKLIEDEEQEGNPPYEFKIGDVNDYGESLSSRKAYMITSLGDVVIDGGKVTVNGTTYGNGDGGISESIKAGIVIAKGNVTVRNSTDFWGTIISQKDIILEGNSSVYAASADVRKLIQINTLVIPFFTKDKGGSKEGESINSMNLVDVVYDNWKKD